MPFSVYSSNDLPSGEWSFITKDSFFSSPEFARVWRAVNGAEAFFLEDEDGVVLFLVWSFSSIREIYCEEQASFSADTPQENVRIPI